MRVMRYADIALLLVPIGLLIAWFGGVRGLTPRGTAAALALLASLGAALVWFGHERGFTGDYRPAHLQGTQIVPGQVR
jgi:hypothetical protein